jgi:UDP-3-O-[3-hydroxymyristoyl] glucosamine N-acyltransferase
VFFTRGSGFTVAELADMVGAKIARPPADSRRITDVASIERAGPSDIALVDGPTAADDLRLSHAGACFASTDLTEGSSPRTTILIVEDPYKAFIRIAAALYPDAQRPSSLFEVRGTASGAFVHPTARIEANVTIDPAAMVGPRAEIGAGTHVGPMTVVGPDVRIGRDCSLEAGASLTNALVGDHVVVQPGCRIGIARDSNLHRAGSGSRLGRAILQDKVVIGANSVVNRGNERDTIIGEGTMIDALVQIPADVVIGRYCRVVTGGQSVDHIDIDAIDTDGLQLFESQIARNASRAERTVE